MKSAPSCLPQPLSGHFPGETVLHGAKHTPKTVSLGTLKAGEKGRIAGFDLPLDHQMRLLEMGLTPGSEVLVIRFAPMGGPIALRVCNGRLALRRREAMGIRVIPL